MSKNQRMQEAFSAYCQAHPELRFFQALRNWIADNIDADVSHVFVAPHGFEYVEDDRLAISTLTDTFYWEDDKLGPQRDRTQD